MDKEWKDSLRERFSDFSVPEPEGLWEGIEQGLAGKKRRKVAPIWWISGAAAAAAAVALVLFPRNAGNQPATLERPQVIAESFSEPEKADTAAVLQETEAAPSVVLPVRPAVRHSLLADASTPVDDKVTEAAEALQEVEALPEEVVTEEIVISETVTGPVSEETGKTAVAQNVDEAVDKPVDEPEYWMDEVDPPLEKRSGFSFGVYREGGQGSGEASEGYGLVNTGSYLTRGMSSGDADTGGLVRMLSANRASSYHAQHRAPVRLGVTVNWSFLPWLGLSSGLNWTALSSEMEESTVGTRTVTRQDLGYLGVPLRLEAGWHPWKNLRLYAGAGGMVETCLLAKSTTDSYIGDKWEGTTDSKPDAGGLLWSVGASAGAEYQFTPHVGVYFAPGLEYHFDNGSTVRSAYTEKPLHWNVNLGVRFHFGN